MPAEVMDVLENALEESGMPRIATRNVPEGERHKSTLLEAVYELF
jgi:hypothetical protein